MTGKRLQCHPLTEARWGDFEQLFGKNGACGGCWCMLWRLSRKQFDSQKGDGNRKAMMALVASGEVPGLLGYLDVLFGIFGSLPTATDDAVGSQQWQLGPEVALGLKKDWGVIGFVAAQRWNVGGSNNEDFSTTTIQYLYGYGLGRGWAISARPTIVADWEANSDNTWTVPLGIGISKITEVGNNPWAFGLGVEFYAVQPDTFGPEFLLKFDIIPIIKNPFAKYPMTKENSIRKPTDR